MTEAVLLGCLPGPGKLSGKEIAALARVASFNRDSGEHRGKRAVYGEGEKRWGRFVYGHRDGNTVQSCDRRFLPETAGSGKTGESGAGGMHAQASGDPQCHGEGGPVMEPGLCQPLTFNTVAPQKGRGSG